jgi:hypothetical protein
MSRGGWNRTGCRTVESCLQVDIDFLGRHGLLTAGNTCGITSCNGWGLVLGSVHVSVHEDLLTLALTASVGRPSVQSVAVVWRACRLGGARPYLICSGGDGSCRRAVSKLYYASTSFRCRGCARLTYASQRERCLDRAIRRADKAEGRLGPNLLLRPKGMWQRTYMRLRNAAELRKSLVGKMLVAEFGRVLRRS